MVVVPVGKQDRSEVIRSYTDGVEPFKEVVGVGIHADVDGNRSILFGDQVGTGKIRRSAKTPHALDDGDDLNTYGGLFLER